MLLNARSYLPNHHKIILAPMMAITDRHCRYFLRQISQHVLLYTEMVTTKALIHGDHARFLAFDHAEHPICLQLGGADPQELADCAILAEKWAYDEVNLNVGCPSDRVQAGEFGLCLMKKPTLVRDCIRAMKESVNIPVSVKTRIGYDEIESYTHLYDFVASLVEVKVDQLTLHARKGWLKGLSPKENRSIPPLKYEMVYRLKQDFPRLNIAINGGILTTQEMAQHLCHVDAVMIGRAAYYNTYILAMIDLLFYEKEGQGEVPNRVDIIRRMQPYCEREALKGVALKNIARHWLGLFHGTPNARTWRMLVTDPKVTWTAIEKFLNT